MYDFLLQLFKAKKFWIKHLDLMVAPHFKSMTLKGLIQFRDYSEHEGKPNRFEGWESGQIKKELKAIVGEKAVVEVTTRPHGRGSATGAYEFMLTQNFASMEEKQKEIDEMLEDAVISEHVYMVKGHAIEKKLGQESHSR